jgi:hypothetical protein
MNVWDSRLDVFDEESVPPITKSIRTGQQWEASTKSTWRNSKLRIESVGERKKVKTCNLEENFLGISKRTPERVNNGCFLVYLLTVSHLRTLQDACGCCIKKLLEGSHHGMWFYATTLALARGWRKQRNRQSRQPTYGLWIEPVTSLNTKHSKAELQRAVCWYGSPFANVHLLAIHGNPFSSLYTPPRNLYSRNWVVK